MRNKLYGKVIRNFLLFGGTLLLIAMMLSCSPAQRLSRLVERHPELIREVTVDVPVMHVVPERTIIDTILLWQHDTVIFETKTAAGYIIPFDTNIFIKIIVKQDTIRDTVLIDIPQITTTINNNGRFPYWIIPVSLGLLVIIIIIIKIR